MTAAQAPSWLLSAFLQTIRATGDVCHEQMVTGECGAPFTSAMLPTACHQPNCSRTMAHAFTVLSPAHSLACGEGGPRSCIVKRRPTHQSRR